MRAIFLSLPALCVAQQSTLQLPGAAKPCSVDVQCWEAVNFKLPRKAVQVARIIGVECDIARPSELATVMITYHMALSRVELWRCQHVTKAALTASLDADTVLSEIYYEQRQIEELSQVHRDRVLGTTNLAILTASTGLGIIAGALSFSNATSDAGGSLVFASGGISTLFSIRGLRQLKAKGNTYGALPNMLEPFLAQPEGVNRFYPDIVWTYLDSRPPGAGNQETRKEQVLAQWESEGWLRLSTPRKTKQRIAFLTTWLSDEKSSTSGSWPALGDTCRWGERCRSYEIQSGRSSSGSKVRNGRQLRHP